MRSLLVLLFLFSVYTSEGQARVIEGIVIASDSKTPVGFASVYHLETNTHCYTDLFGKFSMELTGSEKTYLYVKYTGYECKKQEVDYNEKLVEIYLVGGLTIPPASIVIKDPNSANKTPIDSGNLLCNKYQHEIDSILSIKTQIKK
jgi:carboxypeptidase-like protein